MWYLYTKNLWEMKATRFWKNVFRLHHVYRAICSLLRFPMPSKHSWAEKCSELLLDSNVCTCCLTSFDDNNLNRYKNCAKLYMTCFSGEVIMYTFPHCLEHQ